MTDALQKIALKVKEHPRTTSFLNTYEIGRNTMQVIIAVILLVWTLSNPFSAWADSQTAAKPELNTQVQKFSYSYGIETASRMKNLKTEFDLESLFQGIRDFHSGADLAISVKEAVAIRNEFNRQRNQEMREKRAAQAKNNLLESQNFLKKNKEENGVVETSSGLQYLAVRAGEGPKPTISDRVQVHYAGTMLDGTEFDSSYKRGKPVTFPMQGGKQIIEGWTEGLQQMRVGSKYRLFIPPKLGYGERQTGPIIGPNSLLIFEVEMVGIEENKKVKE